MLDPARLAFAIDIQQRSYRLLRWVGEAMDAGRISPNVASVHADGPVAAVDWVRRNHHLLPGDVQVAPQDVDALGTFFWTYVVTSFDVTVDPGTRGEGAANRCTCDLCVRLVAAGHLRTKKVRTADKRRATDLMVERAAALAAEDDLDVDEATVRTWLEDADRRRSMAFSAYGASLVDRVRGATDGPSTLALWREIAWNRQGSPIKEFRLARADFLEAERHLLRVIRADEA